MFPFSNQPPHQQHHGRIQPNTQFTHELGDPFIQYQYQPDYQHQPQYQRQQQYQQVSSQPQQGEQQIQPQHQPYQHQPYQHQPYQHQQYQPQQYQPQHQQYQPQEPPHQPQQQLHPPQQQHQQRPLDPQHQTPPQNNPNSLFEEEQFLAGLEQIQQSSLPRDQLNTQSRQSLQQSLEQTLQQQQHDLKELARQHELDQILERDARINQQILSLFPAAASKPSHQQHSQHHLQHQIQEEPILNPEKVNQRTTEIVSALGRDSLNTLQNLSHKPPPSHIILYDEAGLPIDPNAPWWLPHVFGDSDNHPRNAMHETTTTTYSTNHSRQQSSNSCPTIINSSTMDDIDSSTLTDPTTRQTDTNNTPQSDQIPPVWVDPPPHDDTIVLYDSFDQAPILDEYRLDTHSEIRDEISALTSKLFEQASKSHSDKDDPMKEYWDELQRNKDSLIAKDEAKRKQSEKEWKQYRQQIAQKEREELALLQEQRQKKRDARLSNFSETNDLNSNSNPSNNNSKFYCTTCHIPNNLFSSLPQVRTHLATVHNKHPALFQPNSSNGEDLILISQCSDCLHWYPTSHIDLHLQQHQRYHNEVQNIVNTDINLQNDENNSKNTSCQSCQLSFPSILELKLHIYNSHEYINIFDQSISLSYLPSTTYRCFLCDYRTKSQPHVFRSNHFSAHIFYNTRLSNAKLCCFDCKLAWPSEKEQAGITHRTTVHEYDIISICDEYVDTVNNIPLSTNPNVDIVHTLSTIPFMYCTIKCKKCKSYIWKKDENEHNQAHLHYSKLKKSFGLNYEQTMATMHPLPCNQCEITFLDENQYDLHILGNHDPIDNIIAREIIEPWEYIDPDENLINNNDQFIETIILRDINYNSYRRNVGIITQCQRCLLLIGSNRSYQLQHSNLHRDFDLPYDGLLPSNLFRCIKCQCAFQKNTDLEAHHTEYHEYHRSWLCKTTYNINQPLSNTDSEPKQRVKFKKRTSKPIQDNSITSDDDHHHQISNSPLIYEGIDLHIVLNCEQCQKLILHDLANDHKIWHENYEKYLKNHPKHAPTQSKRKSISICDDTDGYNSDSIEEGKNDDTLSFGDRKGEQDSRTNLTCSQCKLLFPTLSLYQQHFDTNHNNIELYTKGGNGLQFDWVKNPLPFLKKGRKGSKAPFPTPPKSPQLPSQHHLPQGYSEPRQLLHQSAPNNVQSQPISHQSDLPQQQRPQHPQQQPQHPQQQPHTPNRFQQDHFGLVSTILSFFSYPISSSKMTTIRFIPSSTLINSYQDHATPSYSRHHSIDLNSSTTTPASQSNSQPNRTINGIEYILCSQCQFYIPQVDSQLHLSRHRLYALLHQYLQLYFEIDLDFFRKNFNTDQDQNYSSTTTTTTPTTTTTSLLIRHNNDNTNHNMKNIRVMSPNSENTTIPDNQNNHLSNPEYTRQFFSQFFPYLRYYLDLVSICTSCKSSHLTLNELQHHYMQAHSDQIINPNMLFSRTSPSSAAFLHPIDPCQLCGTWIKNVDINSHHLIHDQCLKKLELFCFNSRTKNNNKNNQTTQFFEDQNYNTAIPNACFDCFLVFTSQEELKAHLQSGHGSLLTVPGNDFWISRINLASINTSELPINPSETIPNFQSYLNPGWPSNE